MGFMPCQLWQKHPLKLLGSEGKNEVQFSFKGSLLLWIIRNIVLTVIIIIIFLMIQSYCKHIESL